VFAALSGLTANDKGFPRDDPAEAGAYLAPESEPYFEIYRADRITLTSRLFSGGDWRWRFCSAAGAPIATSVGYASERACETAVRALRRSAGDAAVRRALPR
jgi:uncharacterized protein YegP (UPF0339 family)